MYLYLYLYIFIYIYVQGRGQSKVLPDRVVSNKISLEIHGISKLWLQRRKDVFPYPHRYISKRLKERLSWLLQPSFWLIE